MNRGIALPMFIFIFLALSACAPLVEPADSGADSGPVTAADTPADTQSEAVPAEAQETADGPLDAFDFNKRMGRGINLGNALEAPYEGAWGLYLREQHFEVIAAAGFDAVRIPIRWSVYADSEPPYTIKDSIFERVDWAVEQAIANDLVAVINIHHYGEIMTVPEHQRERFVALWRQIAEHYADAPDSVYFELLNEPNERMTIGIWNSLLAGGLAAVRESNPDRMVIVGPVEWNNVDLMSTLKLPEEDRNIIGTFHYYRPFEFTHQGANWVEGSNDWLGTTWSGTPGEIWAIRQDFDKAASWSEKTGRPVFLGEFGAYSRADMDSRSAWTAAIVDEAELRGFSWSYWEFGSGFGAYNRGMKEWEPPLLSALIPESTSNKE